MRIGNVSVILLLGLVNFGLLSFQLATGLRWIKVRFGVHKKTGIALVIVATLHGILALFML
ncbi:MAG: hypothetical protein A2511_14775 [Deltaproteobacteria bacterium RIFOXYD12_FULL_50_9]|nr:MAG: hypothetical protein A2511_14775 [Deltaproteobacteria bacterium RIFOXYD12_FULL_50_9]